MKKRIVIIGAGYSGTLTAKQLAKKLGNQNVEITLIDKNPYHTMLTELHEVAAGRIDESGIRLDLKKIFAGRNVNVALDTVKEIDFENHCVVGKNRLYTYDYLVLSAGSRPNFYGISGAETNAYSLWSYEAAVKLNERFHEVFHQAQKMTDAEERKKILTFWVIGAGFSGVEMISELAEYIPVLCCEYGISSKEVSLFNVDGLCRVIPNLTEQLSAKAEKKLLKLGVKLLLNTKVDSIGDEFICLKSGDTITQYDAGTVIWTAGTQSEEITRQAAEVLDSCRGRVRVDEFLKSPEDEHVYVVGDNMYFVAEGEQCPVPQMVENCEQSAHIAAHNLISSITGKGKMKKYTPSFHGVMVSIGSKDGVARVGLPGHMFCLSGFLAIAAKHFINITYFLQVLGWNKIICYLKDEFFTVSNSRSCVGGHFSNRSANILMVPLRVWLGMVWLLAGLYGSQDIFLSSTTSFTGGLEVAVGLTLITGLFTTLSSILSIVLQIVFMSVLGSTSGNIWMILSAIAVMNGGGMVFGLDYYIKPLMRKWWKSLSLIKKWYLYRD